MTGGVSGTLGDAASFDHAAAPAGPVPDRAGAGPAVDPGMLGGMAPGGQGAGDEQERTSRAYRVDGDIFDTSGAAGRISGSLDNEETGRI